jgi:hypothetical protein
MKLSLSIAVLIFLPTLQARASDADFDAYPEGVLAATFTQNGITFSNLDLAFGPGPFPFKIDRADGELGGMEGFSSPMCLGFFDFTPGPMPAISRVLSFEMTTGQLQTEGHLTFWGTTHTGNAVVLEALRGGVVVASDVEQDIGGYVQPYLFEISGVVFDTLRLRGSGPVDGGAFFGVVDSVHIGNIPAGIPFCFGDGSGTACPCGNDSAVGENVGCVTSVTTGGKLRAAGLPSVSADTLVLAANQMFSNACMYFQGTTKVAGGAGAVFGDGLVCAGGSIVRLATKPVTNGASQYPVGNDTPISVRGSDAAGDVRTYQCWFRDIPIFCTAAQYNLTNGVEVTWLP